MALNPAMPTHRPSGARNETLLQDEKGPWRYIPSLYSSLPPANDLQEFVLIIPLLFFL